MLYINMTDHNEFKDKLNTLVGDYIGEYIVLQSEFKQMKKDLTDQLETTTQLNQQLQMKNSELEKKLNEKTILPVETSENKFDIIRGQAKEIAAKDKEILRLTEELVKLKEKNDKSQGVQGWSPTSCPTPKPVVTQQPTPINLNSENTIDDKVEQEESAEQSGEESGEESEEEYEMITYRKVNYFLGIGNKVYTIVKDEDGEDDVGDCIGNWVQQKSGKWKVVKH